VPFFGPPCRPGSPELPHATSLPGGLQLIVASVRDEGLVQLIGVMVCLPPAPPVQGTGYWVRAMDGRIMCYGIISSCCKIAKRFWS